MYETLAKEWQMTSEEIQNAIYTVWYKKYKSTYVKEYSLKKPNEN